MLSEKRIGRITASAAGAILGCAPYTTRADIMRAMVRAAHGAPSEFTGNPATEWGQAMESHAMGMFELSTGLKVQPSHGRFAIHPLIDWLGATPDGIVENGRLLEIKCPFGLKNAENPQFKPLYKQWHYYAQVQIQLACTGLSHAYFYQWAPGGERLESVMFDYHRFNSIAGKLKEFYDEFLIEVKNPEKYLEPKVQDLSAPELVAAYENAKVKYDEAEADLKAAKENLITLAQGKNAIIDGLRVTLVEKEGAIAYAKVVKDLLPAENLEPYRGKPTSYWVIK